MTDGLRSDRLPLTFLFEVDGDNNLRCVSSDAPDGDLRARITAVVRDAVADVAADVGAEVRAEVASTPAGRAEDAAPEAVERTRRLWHEVELDDAPADTALVVTAFPHYDDAGSCTHVSAVLDSERLSGADTIEADSLRLLADASPVGMYHAAPNGHILFANNRFCDITGLTPDQATGRFWRHVRIHDDDAPTVLETVKSTLAEGREFFARFRLRRPDGEIRWVHARAIPVYSGGRTPAGVIGSIADVTDQVVERAEFENQLRLRSAQRAVLVQLGQRALGGIDPNVLMDEAIEAITSTLDVDECHVLEFITATGELRAFAGRGSAFDGMTSRRSPLASTVYKALDAETDIARDERLAAVVIGDPHAPFGVLCAAGSAGDPFGAEDVQFLQTIANVLATAIGRRRVDAALVHQALHDSLTGLPNRTRLLESLGEALARGRRDPGSIAVAFLDVDHFKVVNDGLGHEAGDALLVAVAERLGEIVRPGDLVARFGGDEFVVVCEGVRSETAAVEIAGRIQRSVSRPLMLGTQEVFPTVSIGIVQSYDASDSPEMLIANADAAMYRAKERGRARYVIFDETMRIESVTRLETANELRRAVERDELRVKYQPVLDLRTQEIVLVEALLRWQHPVRGEVLPEQFIADAEETGLIREFGAWVLADACRRAGEWSHVCPGLKVGVTVNLSARQLSDPNLVDMVRSILANAGALDPRRLSLEITENVLMEDTQASLATLAELKALGVSLLVDDFGTGYSSLSYLRRLPVDALKIDQSFVYGLGAGREDAAIVKAIVNMAAALGLGVIAEGVETDAQAAELLSLGCNLAQGFYFSEPVPAESIAQRLRDHERRLGATGLRS